MATKTQFRQLYPSLSKDVKDITRHKANEFRSTLFDKTSECLPTKWFGYIYFIFTIIVIAILIAFTLKASSSGWKIMVWILFIISGILAILGFAFVNKWLGYLSNKPHILTLMIFISGILNIFSLMILGEYCDIKTSMGTVGYNFVMLFMILTLIVGTFSVECPCVSGETQDEGNQDDGNQDIEMQDM